MSAITKGERALLKAARSDVLAALTRAAAGIDGDWNRPSNALQVQQLADAYYTLRIKE